MGTKTDMDRLGFFSELSYHTVGDLYVPPTKQAFNESASHGKQMLCGGSKVRSALNDGYFRKPFVRLQQGDKITATRRSDKIQKIGQSWIPSSKTHPIHSVGSHLGTFSGKVDRLDPAASGDKPIVTKKVKPFSVTPGKKGIGYGYADVGIGPYPEHIYEDLSHLHKTNQNMSEDHLAKVGKRRPFIAGICSSRYFDPNPYAFSAETRLQKEPLPKIKKATPKKPFLPSQYPKTLGGCKGGTFSAFPEYMPCTVEAKTIESITVVNSSGKKFFTLSGPKSTVTRSVLNQTIMKRMNLMNRKSFRSAY